MPIASRGSKTRRMTILPWPSASIFTRSPDSSPASARTSTGSVTWFLLEIFGMAFTNCKGRTCTCAATHHGGAAGGIFAPLVVDRRHVGVAVARRCARRRDLLEARQVVVGQRYVHRRRVLLEVAHSFRSWDRDDVVATVEYPRERELPGRDALLGRHLLGPFDALDVAVEVLALEARVVAAEVVVGEVGRRAEAAREEAAAERGVRDEADPELAHGRQDLGLGIARPQRVLGLQRGDRVNGVGATDRLGRGLRQPEVAHLAGLAELLHRPDRFPNRHRLVDPVLVVEVDVVDPEPFERRVAR